MSEPDPPPVALNQRRRRLGLAAAGLLAAPAFVRHVRAADNPRFTLGVASGQPGPHSLVLWTRLMGLDLPPHVEVRWEMAHDPGFTRIAASGKFDAELAWGHSVHAEPSGLAPDRWYFYRFHALGQRSPVGRTRTAPAADAPAALRAALACCQRWEHGHYAAWRHIASQPYDLVLFAGDYIYEYPSTRSGARTHDLYAARNLDQYRNRYELYKSDLALQAAHAAAPWLLVWDDHEVENDYAADQGIHLSGAAMRAVQASAYQAYWEHLPYSMAQRPRGAHMRIYDRFDWGRLARIHSVDDRQYRDPQACAPWSRVAGVGRVSPRRCAELNDPRRSLLGATQERWLNEGWDTERGWNLLLQQTLMARNSSKDVNGDGGGHYAADNWDGYPAARQRLLETLVQRRVPNPVVLGGDVHTFYVADLKTNFDDDKSAVVASEFCTSSISSNGPPQFMVNTALKHNPHLLHGRGDQRGYIDLRLQAGQLLATTMVVEQPAQPFSAVRADMSFVVEAGRPGAQTA